MSLPVFAKLGSLRQLHEVIVAPHRVSARALRALNHRLEFLVNIKYIATNCKMT
jgi:hypothetical protein